MGYLAGCVIPPAYIPGMSLTNKNAYGILPAFHLCGFSWYLGLHCGGLCDLLIYLEDCVFSFFYVVYAYDSLIHGWHSGCRLAVVLCILSHSYIHSLVKRYGDLFGHIRPSWRRVYCCKHDITDNSCCMRPHGAFYLHSYTPCTAAESCRHYLYILALHQ